MILLLGSITCALAVVMAICSGMALYHAEQAGRNARPYVLPVFVGVAYVVLQGLSLHDAANNGSQQQAVQAMSQIIHTALILSVLLLLHRGTRRRG